MKTNSKVKEPFEDERIQKVILKNKNGIIVKTFDGYVYRIFDEKGRMIELYGNRKRIDDNTNFPSLPSVLFLSQAMCQMA